MTVQSFDPPRDRRPQFLFTSVMACGALVLACYTTVVGLSPSTRKSVEKSLAEQATDDLRARKPFELSGPLKALINDSSKPRVESESHALIGQTAPVFSLPDVDHQSISLDQLLQRGPVILVFYYGYNCDHCVSQLFGIHEDFKYFQEMGVPVVAIGPDSPEKTREKYSQYGAFGFPVLSDVDRHVASRYGLYRPKIDENKEWQAHGTFVLDRNGVVRWANTGPKPFTDNVTLLTEIARLEKR